MATGPRGGKANKRAKAAPKAKAASTRGRQLTPQQYRFVDEYLVDMSVQDAAVRAGYNPKWVYANASRLLQKPHVAAEVARRLEVRSNAVAVSQADIVEQLRRVVFFDIGDLVDPETNKLRPIHDIPKDVRMAMQGLDLVVVNGEITGIKPVAASKSKHMELLMRHMAMLNQAVTPQSSVTFNLNFGGEPEPEPKKEPGVVIDGASMEISIPRKRTAAR